MEPPILDIRNVGYKIGDKTILDRISWRLGKGEHWVILGPNGAGKTTLLKIACGYLWPNNGGDIYRNGQALVDLRQLRESIGWVQSAAGGLVAGIPPAEIVTQTVVSGKFAQIGFREYTGQSALGGQDADPPKWRTQARQYLAEMGCSHLANRRFGTLSQGERQRVLMARARMARPGLLILDEPCAGLDPGGRELLLESIVNLANPPEADHACGGMGMVLVTQHIEEIMPIFENVLVLSGGRIIEKGPTEQVMSPQLIRRLYGVSARVIRSADRYWMIR